MTFHLVLLLLKRHNKHLCKNKYQFYRYIHHYSIVEQVDKELYIKIHSSELMISLYLLMMNVMFFFVMSLNFPLNTMPTSS